MQEEMEPYWYSTQISTFKNKNAFKEIQYIPIQKDQKNVLYSFDELMLERQRKEPDLNQCSVNKI